MFLEYKKYKALIDFEKGMYFGRVYSPENTFITFQSNKKEDILKEFILSVELYEEE